MAILKKRLTRDEFVEMVGKFYKLPEPTFLALDCMALAWILQALQDEDRNGPIDEIGAVVFKLLGIKQKDFDAVLEKYGRKETPQ